MTSEAIYSVVTGNLYRMGDAWCAENCDTLESYDTLEQAEEAFYSYSVVDLYNEAARDCDSDPKDFGVFVELTWCDDTGGYGSMHYREHTYDHMQEDFSDSVWQEVRHTDAGYEEVVEEFDDEDEATDDFLAAYWYQGGVELRRVVRGEKVETVFYNV